jgi:hypothetical protein
LNIWCSKPHLSGCSKDFHFKELQPPWAHHPLPFRLFQYACCRSSPSHWLPGVAAVSDHPTTRRAPSARTHRIPARNGENGCDCDSLGKMMENGWGRFHRTNLGIRNKWSNYPHQGIFTIQSRDLLNRNDMAMSDRILLPTISKEQAAPDM